jgi:predicted nucleic acid-binding protein
MHRTTARFWTLLARLPGASEVEWIEVRQLHNQAELLAAQEKYALGAGELSTTLLGKEIQANSLLLDDYNARKLAVCCSSRPAILKVVRFHHARGAS